VIHAWGLPFWAAQENDAASALWIIINGVSAIDVTASAIIKEFILVSISFLLGTCLYKHIFNIPEKEHILSLISK
jgi:hypothetical protein